MFLDYFDALISKINFKIKKIYFNLFLNETHFKNINKFQIEYALKSNFIF